MQSLFSWRLDDISSPQPSFFSFKSIIENSKMKVRNHFIWSKGDERKQNYYLGDCVINDDKSDYKPLPDERGTFCKSEREGM